MNQAALQLQLQATLFPEACPVTAAVDLLAESGAEARGAVFTRREVVDFILDLVGYSTNAPLHHKRLLEPSFGGGDCLLPTASRLLLAWKSHGGRDATELHNCLRAVELHRHSFQTTREALLQIVLAEG